MDKPVSCLKGPGNVILRASEGYQRMVGVEVLRPVCASEVLPIALADAAHRADQAAQQWGNSRALFSTPWGFREAHCTRVAEGVLVAVSDASEDLRAALACRWPHFSAERIERLLRAVSCAGVDGVARIDQDRDGLLELRDLGALEVGSREVYARWLPTLLKQLRPLPGADATAALEMLAGALGPESMLTPMRVTERYRVTAVVPRPGRDRGCWVLRVYGPGIPRGGRRELTEIQHRPGTKNRARGAAARLEARLNGEGLTLLGVVIAWAEDRINEPLSDRYRQSHQSVIAWLEGSEFSGLVDGQISGREVLRIRSAMSETVKVATGRLYLGLIAQAWRWALLMGRVSQPWPDVPIWRTPVSEKPRKLAYTDEELASLLSHLWDYVGGYYLPLAWTLAETAARVGAVLALRVGDVTRLEGGAGSILIGRGGTTKTGTERRVLVSPALADALDLDRDPGAWLFPSRINPERAVAYGTFRSAVVLWLRAEKLYGQRDVHSLRRRGVVELHRAGVPTIVGQRLTGHASSQVFLSYASKGDYDLTEESRILWIDVAQIRGPHMAHSAGQIPTEGLETVDSSDEHATGECASRITPRALKGLGPNRGPHLRAMLAKSPCIKGLGALLRLLALLICMGVAVS